MNYKASHFLRTKLVNEKSAWTDLDTSKKVPTHSEMTINLSESRHASLGELVRKGGIGEASGRKDSFHAAAHPATFLKFIQTVSNVKVQTKLQLRLTCSPLGVRLKHLQTFMTRSQVLFILLKNTLTTAKSMEYQ